MRGPHAYGKNRICVFENNYLVWPDRNGKSFVWFFFVCEWTHNCGLIHKHFEARFLGHARNFKTKWFLIEAHYYLEKLIKFKKNASNQISSRSIFGVVIRKDRNDSTTLKSFPKKNLKNFDLKYIIHFLPRSLEVNFF